MWRCTRRRLRRRPHGRVAGRWRRGRWYPPGSRRPARTGRRPGPVSGCPPTFLSCCWWPARGGSAPSSRPSTRWPARAATCRWRCAGATSGSGGTWRPRRWAWCSAGPTRCRPSWPHPTCCSRTPAASPAWRPSPAGCRWSPTVPSPATAGATRGTWPGPAWRPTWAPPGRWPTPSGRPSVPPGRSRPRPAGPCSGATPPSRSWPRPSGPATWSSPSTWAGRSPPAAGSG